MTLYYFKWFFTIQTKVLQKFSVQNGEQDKLKSFVLTYKDYNLEPDSLKKSKLSEKVPSFIDDGRSLRCKPSFSVFSEKRLKSKENVKIIFS